MGINFAFNFYIPVRIYQKLNLVCSIRIIICETCPLKEELRRYCFHVDFITQLGQMYVIYGVKKVVK